MKFNEYRMKIVFVMILTLIFYFQIYSVYGIEKENQTNNKQIVQSLQDTGNGGLTHLKIIQIWLRNVVCI